MMEQSSELYACVHEEGSPTFADMRKTLRDEVTRHFSDDSDNEKKYTQKEWNAANMLVEMASAADGNSQLPFSPDAGQSTSAADLPPPEAYDLAEDDNAPPCSSSGVGQSYLSSQASAVDGNSLEAYGLSKEVDNLLRKVQTPMHKNTYSRMVRDIVSGMTAITGHIPATKEIPEISKKLMQQYPSLAIDNSPIRFKNAMRKHCNLKRNGFASAARKENVIRQPMATSGGSPKERGIPPAASDQQRHHHLPISLGLSTDSRAAKPPPPSVKKNARKRPIAIGGIAKKSKKRLKKNTS